METSVTIGEFLDFYKEAMGLRTVDAGTYSPLALAYLGDAVYEVMIRLKVANRGSIQVNKMHRRSAMLVNAAAQAQLIRTIEPLLTEEERAVFKRGRNAKSGSVAKHATVTDYRTATGFEALAGWLFLTRQYDRLTELVSRGLYESGLYKEPEDKEK